MKSVEGWPSKVALTAPVAWGGSNTPSEEAVITRHLRSWPKQLTEWSHQRQTGLKKEAGKAGGGRAEQERGGKGRAKQGKGTTKGARAGEGKAEDMRGCGRAGEKHGL